MKIDPWSSSTYQDYGRLRNEFGIQAFTKELWNDIPHPHRLLRRGVVFGHRDFERIHDAIKHHKPWAILTGLMPSGKMHLGHKMVIDEVMYYQSLGAEIFIAVADIEAYGTRGYTLEQTKEFALNEYIPNYIALGLQPEKCQIYFQSQRSAVKDLGYILGKKVNWSQLLATYGFTASTNMTHVFSPLVQTGDILHVQLKEYGGIKPTLVPVGVDQDPHIRLSRDIAQAHRLYNVMETKDQKIGVFVKGDDDVDHLLDTAQSAMESLGFTQFHRITKYNALYINDAATQDIPQMNTALAHEEYQLGCYGFLPPSATFHRFITGLTGDKMSSSKPESAIFLTDTPEEAEKKIKQAKTGGAVTLEEQKQQGGNPDACVVFELFLYHLIDDDKALKEIYEGCKQGKQLCGMCKQQATQAMKNLLEGLAQKRVHAKKHMNKYLC